VATTQPERAMSTASSHKPRTTRTSSPAIVYTPGPSKSEEIALAISCVLAGRPLPEHLRPQPIAVARPASVREGIARILAGSPAP
jgi:hypothetical protein